MATKLGPKQPVAMKGRVGKKDVDVFVYIPQKTLTKLKLKKADGKTTLKTTDVRGKNKKGRNYPKGARSDINTGRRVQVDFGKKTAKGNPEYSQVTLPNSVALVTFIDEIKGSGALFVRYHGNRKWFPVASS